MLDSIEGRLVSDEAASPHILKVLTYNLFMRAPTFFFWNRQGRRARLLPDQLHGYDVIVLQEAFSNIHRRMILQALEREYPYQTRILGRDRRFRQDGGVVIISRWPIMSEDQRLFGKRCAGFDCWAQKGCVYARIDVEERPCHISRRTPLPYHRHTRPGTREASLHS